MGTGTGGERGRGKAERRRQETEEFRWKKKQRRGKGGRKEERTNFAKSWKTVMPSNLLSSDFRSVPSVLEA